MITRSSLFPASEDQILGFKTLCLFGGMGYFAAALWPTCLVDPRLCVGHRHTIWHEILGSGFQMLIGALFLFIVYAIRKRRPNYWRLISVSVAGLALTQFADFLWGVIDAALPLNVFAIFSLVLLFGMFIFFIWWRWQKNYFTVSNL